MAEGSTLRASVRQRCWRKALRPCATSTSTRREARRGGASRHVRPPRAPCSHDHVMDGPNAYPSQGEAAVADYLTRRGIRFEYEPLIGTRRPDFLSHGPHGAVVLDVYEPVLRLPNS